MKRVDLGLPTLALVAGTRGMLGAGAGLLLGDKLREPYRRRVGWTLLGIGLLSTIPLAVEVLSRVRKSPGKGAELPGTGDQSRPAASRFELGWASRRPEQNISQPEDHISHPQQNVTDFRNRM